MACVLLVACSSSNKPTQAELNSISSPQQWLTLSEQASEPEKSEYRLNAVRLFIRNGRIDTAQQVLNGTRPTTPNSQQEWHLLRAQVYLSQGDMTAAKHEFERVSQNPVHAKIANEYYALEAALYQSEHHYWLAAQSLSQQFPFASDKQQAGLQTQLWQAFDKAPETDTAILNDGSRNADFDGWVSLYRILTAKGELETVIAQLQSWQRQYRGHPGISMLPRNLDSVLADSGSMPESIAVILPLSGKFQSQGLSIRNGMLHAILKDYENKTQVRFYDSGRNSIESIYTEIQTNEHDMIVGPLLKSNVQTLIELSDHQTPILALNQIESGVTQENVSSFALSPEQEARNTVEFLRAAQVKHPLLLQSSGSSYQRIGRTFEQEWRALDEASEAVSETPQLSVETMGASNSMQKQMQRIMGITSSETRARQLASTLGLKLESEPRSRADIDAIYVVASSQQARLLKSFVDVTVSPFAAPVKVVVGPRSHSGPHSEFEGIYVGDIAMIADSENVGLVQQLRELSPQSGYSDFRLFAMGNDALALLPTLSALRHLPGYTVDGLTGALSVTPKGEVVTHFYWGQYNKGALTPVNG
nr:penicillin-binding protein activator [Echinimonas agarilytica]